MVLGHETGFSEVSLKQIFEAADFKRVRILNSRICFRPRIKHIIMKSLQAIFGLFIRFCDYLYLGENRPKCLGAYLIGVGNKNSG